MLNPEPTASVLFYYVVCGNVKACCSVFVPVFLCACVCGLFLPGFGRGQIEDGQVCDVGKNLGPHLGNVGARSQIGTHICLGTESALADNSKNNSCFRVTGVALKSWKDAAGQEVVACSGLTVQGLGRLNPKSENRSRSIFCMPKR